MLECLFNIILYFVLLKGATFYIGNVTLYFNCQGKFSGYFKNGVKEKKKKSEKKNKK
jgi:hypothetical protein